MYDDALLVAIIIGITQIAKRLGLPKRFAALFSWILGMVLAFFYVTPDSLKDVFIIGSALGLSASGLFSGTKSMVRK